MVREKQKDTEIQRLNETINTLLEEAGLRTRKEVESVRKQCNINIGKLMEEMQQMEMVRPDREYCTTGLFSGRDGDRWEFYGSVRFSVLLLRFGFITVS